MNALKRYCIVGVLFTVIVGTISHFVYEWSGNNFLVGLFFPVNESTWEHMKLVFFPMLVYTAVAGRKAEQTNPCIYRASFIGILVGIWMIPVLFYTYSGILGFDTAWLNILTFIVSVIVAFVMVCQVAKKCGKKDSKVLRLVIYAFLIAFMVFTVYPPELGLFQIPPAEGMK